jgi:hypothetical protein
VQVWASIRDRALDLLFTMVRFLCFPRKQSPAKAGRDGIVYLYQHDCSDRPIGIDEAQGSTARVKSLCNHDPANDGRMNFPGNILDQQSVPPRVAPTPVKRGSEQQDIEPVDQKRDSIADEFGEQ